MRCVLESNHGICLTWSSLKIFDVFTIIAFFLGESSSGAAVSRESMSGRQRYSDLKRFARPISLTGCTAWLCNVVVISKT
mmetsp:Transcript_6774/g.13254  ORF Transcript_6774/g.13254 Transcript_6774/m.13254 type:complete len:80 (-) Transcript_6774:65-304(-)